jgi:hypothetical protein
LKGLRGDEGALEQEYKAEERTLGFVYFWTIVMIVVMVATIYGNKRMGQ